MRKNQKTIFATVGAMVAAATLSLAGVQSTLAYGPVRPTYTMASPATEAVFNSITDNPTVGDERDFVRIVEKGATDPETGEAMPYVRTLTLEAGKEYEVYIYYHNNADTQLDTNKEITNPLSVASNVKLATAYPSTLAKDETQNIVAQISWVVGTKASDEVTDEDIQKVWAEAAVTAAEAMKLSYVTGSAKIYNSLGLSGTVLPSTLFSSAGTYLGMTTLNGVVNGCAAYSGHVLYTIQTEAVTAEPETPVEPEDPTPTNPEETEKLPSTATGEESKTENLPTTGAEQLVVAGILMTLVVAGATMYICTHRAVRKVTRDVKGGKKA